MTGFIRSIIKKLDPPDIRKYYKLQREAMNLLVHHAAYLHDGHIDRSIVSSDGHMIPVRVYPPKKISPKKRALVFFHGGGWVVDGIARYHRVLRQLADITGSYVIAVEYRLAPEHKFPAGLNDCYDAAKEVFRYAHSKGMSSRDVILIGDSAGGNLAAAVALKARDTKEFRVRREILIYPASACEYGDNSPYPSVKEKGSGYILTAERMRGYLELYLEDISQKDDPYVAPIKAESLSRMPETLVITAENDPLRDEGEAYARRLRKIGGSVMAFRIKDAYHGFFATDLYRNRHAAKAISMIMYYLRLTD
ncbi:MAG: alpha/beta hydrolase [Huintestinicola sp.]